MQIKVNAIEKAVIIQALKSLSGAIYGWENGHPDETEQLVFQVCEALVKRLDK